MKLTINKSSARHFGGIICAVLAFAASPTMATAQVGTDTIFGPCLSSGSAWSTECQLAHENGFRVKEYAHMVRLLDEAIKEMFEGPGIINPCERIDCGWNPDTADAVTPQIREFDQTVLVDRTDHDQTPTAMLKQRFQSALVLQATLAQALERVEQGLDVLRSVGQQ